MCSGECRLARRRRQAKDRRKLDLEGYRADECARQQKHRAELVHLGAGAGPPRTGARRSLQVSADGAASTTVSAVVVDEPETEAAPACHGPQSVGKCRISQGEVQEIVATVFRLSRTAVEREWRRIQRRIRPILERGVACGGP